MDENDKKISDPIHKLEINCFFEYIIYIFARMYNVDSISLYFLITLLYKSYFDNDYYFTIRPLIRDIIIFIITLSTKFFFGRKRTELKKDYLIVETENFAILILFFLEILLNFFYAFCYVWKVYYFCRYVFETVI